MLLLLSSLALLACMFYVVGLLYTIVFVFALVFGLVVLLKNVMDRIFVSIPVVPPPAEWAGQEDLSECSLFSFFPELKTRLAWRRLGQYPTPVEEAEIEMPSGRKRRVLFKREDLSDSSAYSGNKVRTLEFQLAAAAAAPGRPTLYSMGAVGSNQTVALSAHAARKFPDLKVQLLLAAS